MKLAAKLVLLFLVCLALVVGVFSFLSMRQAQDLALAEHEQLAADLAAILQSDLRSSQHTPREMETLLTVWSEEINHVRARLVNPQQASDPLLRPSVPADLLIFSTKVTTVSYPDSSGHSTLYTYVPLGDSVGTQLEVAVAESFWSDRLSQALRSSAISLMVVSAVTSLVILLGGLWMVGKPLDQLVEKVHRVGQGDLSSPVDLRRGDELGKLGQAVNEMCEQLEQQRSRIDSETQQRLAAVEQLRHADRLRTVGRLAAGLAHEIGTPLNVVSGRAELIASGKLSVGDVQSSALTIKEQSQRIATIVQELLNFARSKTPQRAPVDLNLLLQETINLLRPMADKHHITIGFDPWSNPATTELDSAQMQQVFSNLLVNALHATQAGTASNAKHDSGTEKVAQRIDVSIDRLRSSEIDADRRTVEQIDQAESYWRVKVTDFGIGIGSDVLDNIFEPFFTTKDVGEGTGLGLSIAYGIVREHAGWIGVESQPGSGSQFTVYLPATSPPAYSL
ncbi:MAG: HAMP domain-containing sensor histidine kinase [Aureliella sp.]